MVWARADPLVRGHRRLGGLERAAVIAAAGADRGDQQEAVGIRRCAGEDRVGPIGGVRCVEVEAPSVAHPRLVARVQGEAQSLCDGGQPQARPPRGRGGRRSASRARHCAECSRGGRRLPARHVRARYDGVVTAIIDRRHASHRLTGFRYTPCHVRLRSRASSIRYFSQRAVDADWRHTWSRAWVAMKRDRGAGVPAAVSVSCRAQPAPARRAARRCGARGCSTSSWSPVPWGSTSPPSAAEAGNPGRRAALGAARLAVLCRRGVEGVRAPPPQRDLVLAERAAAGARPVLRQPRDSRLGAHGRRGGRTAARSAGTRRSRWCSTWRCRRSRPRWRCGC